MPNVAADPKGSFRNNAGIHEGKHVLPDSALGTIENNGDEFNQLAACEGTVTWIRKNGLVKFDEPLYTIAPIVVAALGTPPATRSREIPSFTPPAVATPSAVPVMVFVLPNGKRYHRSGCPHLHQGTTMIDLTEAPGNYKPCGTCKPGV